MKRDQEKKRVPLGEVAKGLNQGLEQSDITRLAGLERLRRVRAVKAVSIDRERMRLSAKLGADHPRVIALGVKLDANRELQRDVKLGLERAQTPPVKPQPDAWVLHGHVRNAARQGLPDLTVALYDDGRWLEALGHACTDKRGYFQLSHRAAKTKDTPVPTSLRIHVLDRQGKTLAVDPRPITPKLGAIDYREIIIDENADCSGHCTPPPGASQPKPPPAPEPKPAGRYLGSAAKTELHDLKRAKPQCQIDEIKPENRVYFATQKKATDAGYDFCAYCFGKDKAKR